MTSCFIVWVFYFYKSLFFWFDKGVIGSFAPSWSATTVMVGGEANWQNGLDGALLIPGLKLSCLIIYLYINYYVAHGSHMTRWSNLY